MKRLLAGIAIITVILTAAWWLYINAEHQSGYFGLPVVACIDPTLTVKQNFSLTVQIKVNDKIVPLDPSIGHDPGHCLRVIHTNDASGTVFIQSNDAARQYTLAEFFNVWHKQFGGNTFLGNPIGTGHGITILVNGKAAATDRDILLKPEETINIYYR